MSVVSSLKFVRRAVACFVVLGAAVCGSTALAQGAPVRPAVASNGTLSQGIQVSGYWRIDVRNPDGTLAKHVEFENALTGNGASTLTSILTGYVYALGGMVIELDSSAVGNGICSGHYAVCRIVANDQLSSGNAGCGANADCAAGLSIISPAGTITLAANVTAASTGVIQNVATNIIVCDSGTGVTCRVGSGTGVPAIFTSKSISPALNIIASQIVQISVVLSFS